MNTKILAVLLVGAASIVAAGTGAYLAVRHGQTPSTAQMVESQNLAASAVPDGAVAETEGLVTPEPSEADNTAPATPPAEPAASRPASVARPSPAAPARTAPARTAPPRAARSEAAGRPVTAAEPARESTVRAEPPLVADPLPPPSNEVPVYSPSVASAPPPPPLPRFEEVVVPADAVIGLQIENNVSSETARVEDRVDARVTRDVRAGGIVAIPAGSKVQGSVTLVEKGGKVKERARLGVRFHTLVLADGTRVPLQTETIFREGDSPAGESAAKIGGAAVGGAIIGAILGGGKGAAIGGSIGAAGGTAATMAGGRNAATLTAGSTVTARLSSPATVTVEQ
jgi:hypothetical protein